ncbi:MAG: RDD family protein [Gammaproteobacteria bacterium]
MLTNPNINLPSASLFKQLAAMLYDSFLIFAILFVATVIALIVNNGEAIESSPVFSLYLVLVIFLFYSWFWSKCGQTLGMRVWKIQIINDYGRNPAWQVCILRLIFAIFSMACLGLGYWWRLFKPYTWHDKLSQTRIIDVSQSSHTN